MAEIKYVITDEEGIHARPAGTLVKFVKELGCSATITKGEKTVDITRLMAVMSLGAKKGDEVTVSCDNQECLDKIESFLKENL
ncbi:MAG: HPr family phosphocarrier protein [Lachnospiraceae bacterium]|nr:HPr family phosphocarrier protein [Lachnospiraceae bacterium]